MKIYEATEQAYKNGYEQGKKDGYKQGEKDAFKWMVKFELTLIGLLLAVALVLGVIL